jgi:hypothetical protein
MNLKRSILGISTLLLIAGMLGCSEDDKSPSYASCDEILKALRVCDDKYHIVDCSYKSSFAEVEACENELDEKCWNDMMGSGICGGASLDECKKHFNKECWGE